MSATGKRLDRIAANLTPQAAFLVWLAEAKQYPTITAWVTADKLPPRRTDERARRPVAPPAPPIDEPRAALALVKRRLWPEDD